ncbi:hypothetical protein GGR26_001300 [Lewinella marina]|nr:hypothetical protein [Neolewinella marina]
MKSLGGESVTTLQPQERGFADDRRWMLIDGTGRFITQRENPHLARYSGHTVGEQGLRVMEISTGATIWESQNARPDFSSSLTVTVWDDTFQAVEVAGSTTLASLLDLPGGRLVYMPAESMRPVDQRYANPEETVSFADGFPYLIANTASLDDLSRRRGRELEMTRFRPNIVIDAPEAYAEDNWATLRIGSHRFQLPKPCARCIMVTHEPETGERDPAVLTTLADYRKRGKKVLFGENALWRGGEGSLSVGDPAVVEGFKNA